MKNYKLMTKFVDGQSVTEWETYTNNEVVEATAEEKEILNEIYERSKPEIGFNDKYELLLASMDLYDDKVITVLSYRLNGIHKINSISVNR